MSLEIIVHLHPYIHHRMDQIDPCWPSKGAFIDLDPQEHRLSFIEWQKWVRQHVSDVRSALQEERFNVDDMDGQDRKDYDRLIVDDRFLNELLAVLTLPRDVVAGARKRIFGDFAPVNDRGQILFSEDELNLIAGAFWSASEYRIRYVGLKYTAEAALKRAKRVADVFASLRKELD